MKIATFLDHFIFLYHFIILNVDYSYLKSNQKVARSHL